MKILLTGATGFLGFRTLEKLVEWPAVSEVVATGRTLRDSHKVNHPKVSYVLGDLSDAAFVRELVKDVNYIIHAAALSAPWGDYETFKRANLVSQQNLLAASKGRRLQKYVFISTPSLYFDSSDRLNIKESDPLPRKFINHYAATKRLAEIELEKSSLPYVILRPRALTGRGDTVIMPRLIRAFDEGRLKTIGKGTNMVDLTSVANVVDAIMLSLTASDEATNEIYNISNGEPVALWEKVALVLKSMGKELSQQKISYSVANSLAHVLEWKAKITNGKEPVLTVYSVGTLAKSFTMDISKAKALLGYQPKLSTDEAIHEFVDWYRTHEGA